MNSITAQDVEFLIFLEEELIELENNSFGFLKEAELRVLATRLRNLLHQKEGSLKRAAEIFNHVFHISPENITYIYSIDSDNSPAVYNVEFHDSISAERILDFKAKYPREDTFAFAYPIVGFDRNKSVMCTDSVLLMKEYIDLPIFGLNETVISRGQLISYLSNKKGLAHFSESRDKKWQSIMDIIWNYKLTQNNKEGGIRGSYEAVQRIANEVLNTPSTLIIRKRTQQLRQHVDS